MKRASNIAAAALAVSLAAVQSPPAARAQGLPDDIQVHLGGAGAIGAKLMQALAVGWAGKLGLPAVRVNAGAVPEEYEVAAERPESKQKMHVSVSAKGTLDGQEPLMRGQGDFWMAVRRFNEADLESMRKKGVPGVPSLQQMLSPAAEHLIGLDPVANIVSPRNPVKSLSLAQIRGMYTGKITDWSQVGGPNLPVQLATIGSVSGTAGAFCDREMGIADPVKCFAGMAKFAFPVAITSQDIADTVAGAPGAIGYVAYVERRNARAVPIATECGTTMEPTPFRVKAGEYPVVLPLFLYANPTRPLSASASAFLDFIESSAGQAIVAKTGKVDLSPSLAPESYADDRVDHVRDAQDGGRTRIRPLDARAFEEATTGAARLSVTFRFLAGTTILDSRGESDVTRLVQLMQEPPYRDQQVILIGFSGAGGDYSEDRALSRDRASSMRERLTSLGLKDVVSLGVGPAAAVACNLDPDTASLNHRVEVWLRKRG